MGWREPLPSAHPRRGQERRDRSKIPGVRWPARCARSRSLDVIRGAMKRIDDLKARDAPVPPEVVAEGARR
jgi:hypothetical protein